jgi:tetratricopeptide (TPR) repeat protein
MLLEEAGSLSKSADRVQKLLRAAEFLLADAELEDAIRVLEGIRAESPENLEAAVLLARAYTRANRIEEALAQLNAVLEQNRGKRIRALAPVYEEKANTHLEEGFLTDALGALAKAFEMDPKNARLGMRFGRLALESDEHELAQRALRAVAIMKTADVDGPEGARTDTKAEANYALAVLAHKAGDARKAKVLVSKALSENPSHQEARALLTELDRR